MNFNPEQFQPVPVNLDRNVPFESGLEYNPEYYYRMIGQSGYEDFLSSGQIQAKQDSKQEYEKAYFFKGAPINRYAQKTGDFDYFVEVNPGDEELFSESAPGQYPHSIRNISKDDNIKIYKTNVLDRTSEVVFDGM